MSDYYDQFHRWEALAEFHFNINDEVELNDDNLIYCLCSRVFIRDFVKTYYDEEAASESDQDLIQKTNHQELEDQSHVHFSDDTCYKVKCDKDEGASCYGSASHTENYCSTDEHDPAQVQYALPHALQPSDSGADLTYQDCHFDYAIQEKVDDMDQDMPTHLTENVNENYLSEDSWDKFWAVNGERIIWDSWISKYSDYINPSYLDENNDLIMDDNNIPKPKSSDNIKVEEFNKNDTDDDQIRERKYSYDSKVNPFKKRSTANPTDSIAKESTVYKDECWLPVARRRSCSEHDRMLSPRTITGTDSMTNVTKMTMSSFDVTSHTTSVSTPTDTYSVSSTSSEDQSNDKTRIANVGTGLGEGLDQMTSEELDTEQYWQFLWKKHFGEQYALHLANYTEKNKEASLNVQETKPSTDVTEDFTQKDMDTNIQPAEMSITEVEVVKSQVDNLQIQDKTKEDKPNKQKRKSKKNNSRYIGSVGLLLQNLLKEKQDSSINSMFDKDVSSNHGYECNEVSEAGDTVNSKDDQKVDTTSVDVVDGMLEISNSQEIIHSNSNVPNDDNDDDEPPEEKQVTLKRSHELDEEDYDEQEKINSTFQIMGFAIGSNKMPKGEIVYRKRIGRLRAPRHKRFTGAKKTYFDDDGNPCKYDDQDSGSQGEKEIQTDDECKEPLNISLPDEPVADEQKEPGVETEQKLLEIENEDESHRTTALEASNVALPADSEDSLGEADCEDLPVKVVTDEVQTEVKRRRRQKQKRKVEENINVSDMPEELKNDPKMIKYWKKRHSLFHRFDEGIKLDRESWFSVTPENVAWHIANKYTYDVVLDAFCGAGGNTIQFARVSKKVIAIDIDPEKIEMAKHNASIYGVADRIEFIVGDFFELAPTLSADMVFLSPPWGGPKYSENFEYDLETMLIPKPASELMAVARTISSSISLYLPRNTNSDQILSLAKKACCSVEVEQSYLDRRFVAITAYFYE